MSGLGFGLGRAWMALGRHYSGDLDRWDAQWRRHGGRMRRVLTVVLVVLPATALTAPWLHP